MDIVKVKNDKLGDYYCAECAEFVVDYFFMAKTRSVALILCERCCKSLEKSLKTRGIVEDWYIPFECSGADAPACVNYKSPCAECQERENELSEALEKRAEAFSPHKINLTNQKGE